MKASSSNPFIRRAFVGALLVGILLAGAGCSGSARAPALAPAADELTEPAVLASSNGVLDVLMVAHPARVPAFAPYDTTGWVYTVCNRPVDGSNRCPESAAQANDYGGTRLQLNPGDGEAFLALNPTNLHTHGMLVAPSYPAPGTSTWGDNVFVLAFNSANGSPVASEHLHGTVQKDAIDYEYDIPAGHPSGLYWFHPHVHGISGNQITAGLAGIITLGQVSDYACPDASCAAGLAAVPVRHLIVKDSQVERDGTLSHQQNSSFCTTDDSPGSSSPVHQGGCDGQDQSANGGANHAGGRWFFTINGQQYPTMTVGAPSGQIWRITNASASTTYDLNLWQPDEQREMVMKMLAIDGVSIDNNDGTSSDQMVDVAGNKFQPVPCQGGASPTGGVCTMRLHLMPSSRAEVWVTYRDAQGAPAVPPAGAHAVLRTSGYRTGPTGDNWAAVDLAKVAFGTGSIAVGSVSSSAQTSNGTFAALVASLAQRNQQVQADPTCTALPAGHKRRIFFNVPSGNPDAFGLGYEELDENDVPVPGTFQDVKPFDPMAPSVCVQMAGADQPTVERWELVNLAGEDHNFHIHQVRFRVLSSTDVASTALPDQLTGLPCATLIFWRYAPRAVRTESLLPCALVRDEASQIVDERNGLQAVHLRAVVTGLAVKH